MIANEQKLLNQNETLNEINTNKINQNNTSLDLALRKPESYNFIPVLKEKSVLFSGMFVFKNINITLIDNSSGSYYPFAK